MLILGIDPGLAKTGWGIVRSAGSQLIHVEHGTIITQSDTNLGCRLEIINRHLRSIIVRLAPNAMAVEQPFVHKDPSAALKLGYARAAALLAGAQAGLSISEYTPNYIKKAIVGSGHATKEQVIFMVRRLLPMSKVTQTDAADALAVAITHAHLNGKNTGSYK